MKIRQILKFDKSWVASTAAAAAKSLQSCLTLCDPIDGGWKEEEGHRNGEDSKVGWW